MSFREKVSTTFHNLMIESEKISAPYIDQEKVALLLANMVQDDQDLIYGIIYTFCRKKGIEIGGTNASFPFNGKSSKSGVKFIFADFPPELQLLLFLYTKNTLM